MTPADFLAQSAFLAFLLLALRHRGADRGHDGRQR